MNYRVLIAEDEPHLLEILCDYFRSRGDVPTAVNNGVDALDQAEMGTFDGVLLDIMMKALFAQISQVLSKARLKAQVLVLNSFATLKEREF